jgi:peroxiredoxin/tetratricopeptide (TPR) repeat protein
MFSLAVAVVLMSARPTLTHDDDAGHSEHGSAFDSGMRTRPWIIKGIGDTPFPITTKSPEVQVWFNQGYALLQSFWFEEAERSFRWCLKLDPDCAMAYWGLARCGFTWFERGDGRLDDKQFARYKTFLAEAVKRKGTVTDRERAYIEVWEKGFADNVPNRAHRMMELLQGLVASYPDDIEAKTLLALFGIDQTDPKTNQSLIDQVLAKNPMHPGALHASIHDWDDADPTKALAACALYGKAAPGIGHALHMPGHIYSKIGMWHEAATSMDAATRVELKYMNDRLALPFENWDYAHNRNYLCYIQEQLGMLNASLEGARDMIAAPRDKDVRGYDNRAEHSGFRAIVRAMIKFERWDDILKPGSVPWEEGDESDRRERPLDEILALTGKGELAEARKRLDSVSNKGGGLYRVVEAELLLAEGKAAEGVKELNEVAAGDGGFRGDPPDQPWPVARLVGDACLRTKDYEGAIKAYNQALLDTPNDAFSLSGLAQAYHGRGDDVQAEKYADRLVYEWSDADPGLKWLTDVKALGLGKKPLADTLAPERRYDPASLAHYGPSNWKPFAAPKLDVRDVNGKRVTLNDYRGKNVLLIFFLGESCVHCVEQLDMINRRMAEFAKENTVVLAVCSASPQKNRDSVALGDVKITLLSDNNHENARRFASYDDFENLELHSTILIDGDGKVRWKRTGGDPYTNLDFLLKELRRWGTRA